MMTNAHLGHSNDRKPGVISSRMFARQLGQTFDASFAPALSLADWNIRTRYRSGIGSSYKAAEGMTRCAAVLPSR